MVLALPLFFVGYVIGGGAVWAVQWCQGWCCGGEGEGEGEARGEGVELEGARGIRMVIGGVGERESVDGGRGGEDEEERVALMGNGSGKGEV